MSTHIQAFTPDTDPEYVRHKKVFLVCKESRVGLPPETAAYFGYDVPEDYLLDDKLNVTLKEGEHYHHLRMGSSEGFEIDIVKLPPGVTKLRFYNNW